MPGSVNFFWQGMVVGFSIAAPVGPIGVLCIRHSLTSGRLAGFSAGMGAASADSLFAMLGAFGLTAVSSFLVGQQFWLRLVGGLFLCWLGLRILRAPKSSRAALELDLAQGKAIQPLRIFLSAFVLTLSNPLTILSFAAVFAGLGLAAGAGAAAAGWVVLGVFSGSAAWWLLLSSAASALRSRLSPDKLSWIDLFSGVVIMSFGLAILFSLLSTVR
jgi:threonine/homoserine/homoserine lactone efflux protein